MKEIELTRGYKAIVDDEDYEYLNQYKWHARVATKKVYAVRRMPKIRTLKMIMHREIIQAPDGLFVDHINGNGLDNRKSNLRLCTRSQNNANSEKIAGTSSKYKGVSWINHHGKWFASIRVHGKAYNLGGYSNEMLAALAYNEAALKYFGEFAKINDFNN